MRFGSQSNQAPGLPAASPAYPEALPSESSAACFRQAAAAKIPVLLRFPALHQPPELPRVRRYAPRNTPLPFGCSNLFFLGDHDSRSGPFIRGKFGGDRKAASPCKNAATRQHRPAIMLPPADAFLV